MSDEGEGILLQKDPLPLISPLKPFNLIESLSPVFHKGLHWLGVDRRSLAEITNSVGTSLSIWKKPGRSGAERL